MNLLFYWWVKWHLFFTAHHVIKEADIPNCSSFKAESSIDSVYVEYTFLHTKKKFSLCAHYKYRCDNTWWWNVHYFAASMTNLNVTLKSQYQSATASLSLDSFPHNVCIRWHFKFVFLNVYKFTETYVKIVSPQGKNRICSFPHNHKLMHEKKRTHRYSKYYSGKI